MKRAIGVMGASGGELTDEMLQGRIAVGEAIAEHDTILATGACPGLRGRAGSEGEGQTPCVYLAGIVDRRALGTYITACVHRWKCVRVSENESAERGQSS